MSLYTTMLDVIENLELRFNEDFDFKISGSFWSIIDKEGATISTFYDLETLKAQVDMYISMREHPIEIKEKKRKSKDKPKSNEKGIPEKDKFQTPPNAVDLIIPFIPEGSVIWEWAAGERIVTNTLRAAGFKVIDTDIMQGQDFLTMTPPDHTIMVTNPPYSIKEKMVKHALKIGTPFALLMPTDSLHTMWMYKMIEAGNEIVTLMPNRRISFKPPFMDWRKSSAKFHSSWFLFNFPNMYVTDSILRMNYENPDHDAMLERIENEKVNA